MPSSRVAAAALLLALVPAASLALDDERSGFFAGMGLGPGFTRHSDTSTVDALAVQPGGDDRLQVATDVRLGVGVTPQCRVYAFSRAGWDRDVSLQGDAVLVAGGVTGVGLGLYAYPLPPSTYLTAGAGLATWSAPFDGNVEPWIGPGVTAGLGHEFSRRWSLEGTAMWVRPQRSEGAADLRADAVTFVLTLNATVL